MGKVGAISRELQEFLDGEFEEFYEDWIGASDFDVGCEVCFSVLGDSDENEFDFSRYERDPVGFATDVLGVKFSFDWRREQKWAANQAALDLCLPGWAAVGLRDVLRRAAEVQWTVQQDILLSIRDNRKTTVRACFSVGKTFIAAVATVWKTYAFRPCLVITSGPTERRLEDNLWREIDTLRENALVPLPGKSRKLKLKLNSSQLALGFVAKAQGGSAGYHSKANVFLVIDECSAVSNESYAGFHGLGADDDYRELDIGNPVSTTGWYKESHCNPDEEANYFRIAIDAERTPNVLAGRTIVPGIVKRTWVDWARRTWLERGIKAFWFRKVKGEFYEFSGDVVIPREWVELAIKRWDDDSVPWEGRCSLAIDVAGGGRDSSVASILRGRRLSVVDSWQEADPQVQAEKIFALQQEHQATRVVIDKTGLGAGVYYPAMRLLELVPGVSVVGVAFNSSPSPEVLRPDGERSNPDDCAQFTHILDQMFFAMRNAFDPRNPNAIALDPKDTKLHRELPLRTWGLEGVDEQKIKVERKRDMKRRGVSDSPDDADSALLHWGPDEPQLWWSGKDEPQPKPVAVAEVASEAFDYFAALGVVREG